MRENSGAYNVKFETYEMKLIISIKYIPKK